MAKYIKQISTILHLDIAEYKKKLPQQEWIRRLIKSNDKIFTIIQGFVQPPSNLQLPTPPIPKQESFCFNQAKKSKKKSSLKLVLSQNRKYYLPGIKSPKSIEQDLTYLSALGKTPNKAKEKKQREKVVVHLVNINNEFGLCSEQFRTFKPLPLKPCLMGKMKKLNCKDLSKRSSDNVFNDSSLTKSVSISNDNLQQQRVQRFSTDTSNSLHQFQKPHRKKLCEKENYQNWKQFGAHKISCALTNLPQIMQTNQMINANNSLKSHKKNRRVEENITRRFQKQKSVSKNKFESNRTSEGLQHKINKNRSIHNIA